jgi:adenylate cyclase
MSEQQDYAKEVRAHPQPAEEVTRRTVLGYAASAPAVLLGQPAPSQDDAWDCYRKGVERYLRFTPQDNLEARRLFEQATQADPQCARAYGLRAATYRQAWTFGWTPDPARALAEAARWAQHAVALARREPPPQPSLPHVLEQWGFVCLYQGHHTEAQVVSEEAIRCAPHLANGHGLAALVQIYRGQPDTALRHTAEALRLDPRGSHFYDYHRGQAYTVWGLLTEEADLTAAQPLYQLAAKHLRASLHTSPNFRSARTYLVAALQALGQQEEAGAETTILRAQGRPPAADPQFQALIERTHPYEDSVITRRLLALWQAAEHRAAVS